MSGQLDADRAAVDEIVTAWPEVRAKQVFGHRGYVRSGSMFGFIADRGVAVRVIGDLDSEELLGRDGAQLFAFHGKPMKGWVVLPVDAGHSIDPVVDSLRQAWEGVAR